jgi:hypothetical protein
MWPVGPSNHVAEICSPSVRSITANLVSVHVHIASVSLHNGSRCVSLTAEPQSAHASVGWGFIVQSGIFVGTVPCTTVYHVERTLSGRTARAIFRHADAQSTEGFIP